MIVGGNGTVVAALAYVGVAAADIGVETSWIFWIELDRLIVVLDGAVLFTLACVGIAAVEEGCSQIRIQADCLVVV